VISSCVLIFLALVSFVFWVGGLIEKPVLASVSGEGSEIVPHPAGD
jgi:hypothetical protein